MGLGAQLYNYDIVGYASQKTFKRELEVENWIKKYDEEMGEKQVCYQNRVKATSKWHLLTFEQAHGAACVLP